MSVAVKSTSDQRGWFYAKVTGVASTANGGQGEIENPEGCTLGIVRAFMYFITGSTEAGNLSIGVGASGAAPIDLCSAMDVIQATVGGKLFHLPAAEVAETENPTALWHATDVIGLTASATEVGLSAYLFVEYIRLPAS